MGPVSRAHVWAFAVAVLAWAAPAAALTSTNVMVGVKQNMQAILIAPDDSGPHPGVLVLHTSGGLEQADLDFAKRLAGNGYVCLVPSFMAAYGITAASRGLTFTTDAGPIYADFIQALDMLRTSDKVHGSKLGAVGFSNGGYFAAWLAATGKVQAAVGYYGAYSGAGTDRTLGRFKEAFNAASTPLLILHGTGDTVVPVQAAQTLAEIARAARAPVEIHLYGGATHVFDRGSAGKRALGTLSPEVAADAWTRTLAFYAAHLK
jgi:carboxymethylenebutenolidase